MKIKYKTLGHLLCGATCAAALLIGSGASAQDVFVSTYQPGVIYEFTPGGSLTTFDSGLNYPFGMTFDSTGDLFIANSDNDAGSGNILEITAGGTKSVFASGLDPKGLAFNSAGDLFESDYHSGDIYEFSNGVKTVFATGFNAPQALAFNSAGDLFVGSGLGNNEAAITEITPNGTKTVIASGLSGSSGLAFNNQGDLFEADTGTGNIYEFDGGVESTYASGLASPVALAFDSAGDLFVTDSTGNGTSYVTEIMTDGDKSVVASGLYQPNGIAILPVPEPSALALLAMGGAGLFLRYRRKI